MLRAAVFPQRDRSSGLTDRYTDWGVDSSYLTALGSGGSLSAMIRFEHESGNLSASCALGLVGESADPHCARFELAEWRAAVRYTWQDRVGLSLAPFKITGSRNVGLFGGNGLPDSSGLMGQVDYTLWPAGNSPLGPLANARIGVQYTIYDKFNGSRRNFDGLGTNAHDNDALRAFLWLAF